MTRDEHLMTIAMEECNEVAQRLSKALRFGLDEIQPGQSLTNRQRIRYEYSDLAAVLEMLDPATNGAGGKIHPPNGMFMDRKREKVEQFLAYSESCGTLSSSPSALQAPQPQEPVTFATTTVDGYLPAAPGTPFNGISRVNEQFASAVGDPPEGTRNTKI